MSFSFTKPRFILCEGDDDKGFLETLIAVHGLPDCQVCHAAECNPEHIGGKTGFTRSLRGIEPISGFDKLKAVLIVADNDVQAIAFSDAQKALSDNGYTPPAAPGEAGEIKGRAAAILMIPGPDKEGNLEVLCLPALHQKWPLANGCVEAFLQCTGATAWDKQGSLHKARARAAIVGYNEPDPYKGIGHLFRNGTLSVLHPCFDGVAAFLQGFLAKTGA
jgi:hypothetical protein